MTAHLPPQAQRGTATARTPPMCPNDAPPSPASNLGPLQGLSGDMPSLQVLPGFDPPDPPGSRPLVNRRFNLEPLADAMGVQLVEPTDRTGNQFEPEYSIGCRELGDRLGIPHRTMVRWRTLGIPRWGTINGITVDMPDHLACHGAGVHPSAVWPDWWTEDTEALNDGS